MDPDLHCRIWIQGPLKSRSNAHLDLDPKPCFFPADFTYATHFSAHIFGTVLYILRWVLFPKLKTKLDNMRETEVGPVNFYLFFAVLWIRIGILYTDPYLALLAL